MSRNPIATGLTIVAVLWPHDARAWDYVLDPPAARSHPEHGVDDDFPVNGFFVLADRDAAQYWTVEPGGKPLVVRADGELTARLTPERGWQGLSAYRIEPGTASVGARYESEGCETPTSPCAVVLGPADDVPPTFDRASLTVSRCRRSIERETRVRAANRCASTPPTRTTRWSPRCRAAANPGVGSAVRPGGGI